MDKNIILVGLMGAGKSTIGRLLAAELHLPFIDALPAEDIPTFRTFFRVLEEVLADRADEVVHQVLLSFELHAF